MPIHTPLFLFDPNAEPGLGSWLRELGFRACVLRHVEEFASALDAHPEPACGALLDLRHLPRSVDPTQLALAVSDPRLRCLCLMQEADLERADMFELALRHCMDTLLAPVDRATLHQALCSLTRRLDLLRQAHRRTGGPPIAARLGEMVGVSRAMQRLFGDLYKVADSAVPVFIAGETGVGKELAARAIHDLSPRRDKPFVAINCGAIPPHLMLSELFGYEKGAFTGAAQRKLGRIEMANGGTLLLDEIGDMPADSQVALLRFLQEGRIERLGATHQVPVDVRVISATHVDLHAAQESGRFRPDLFHRLCVVQLNIPPLRERRDDLLPLAQHALDTCRTETRTAAGGFAADALRAMQAYDWPGNVRELVNRIRRAVVMCESSRITAADLGLAAAAPAATAPSNLEQARAWAEAQAIACALEQHAHCATKAAASLGVSRATLYRLMQRHGLEKKGGART